MLRSQPPKSSSPSSSKMNTMNKFRFFSPQFVEHSYYGTREEKFFVFTSFLFSLHRRRRHHRQQRIERPMLLCRFCCYNLASLPLARQFSPNVQYTTLYGLVFFLSPHFCQCDIVHTTTTARGLPFVHPNKLYVSIGRKNYIRTFHIPIFFHERVAFPFYMDFFVFLVKQGSQRYKHNRQA